MAVVVALALPASTQADGWTSPLDITAASRDSGNGDVAVDASGTATTVWSRNDGTHYVVQARRTAADGTLGPVVDLSAPGRNAGRARVAVDATGAATVVWSRDVTDSLSSNRIIQARRIGADGALGPIHDLTAPDRDNDAAQVAVDAAGRATIVWHRNFVIQTRQLGVDGDVGPTRDLSGTNAQNPQLGLDGAGGATVVWSRFTGANDIVQLRRVRPDGTLGGVRNLSTSGVNGGGQRVVVAPDGTATAAWERSPGPTYSVEMRRIAPDDTLGRIVELAPPNARAPDLILDAAGNATASWATSGSGGALRRIAPDGTLGPVVEVFPPGVESGSPQLVVDAAGTITAAWDGFTGGDPGVAARRIAADGTRGPIEPLSAPGQSGREPHLAIDPAGNVDVVWTEGRPDRHVVTRAFLRTPSCRDTSAATAFESATPVSLPCSGRRLSYQAVAPPSHGSVDAAGPTATYRPNAGFSGADQFTFKAVNAGGESAATARLTVGAGPPGAGNPAGQALPVLGPASGRATAALRGRRLRFRRNKAGERASCANVAGDACALALTLKSRPASRARLAARTRRARPKVLARARKTLAGGQTTRITWRLTAAGRRALRRRNVSATLAGTSRNRAGQSVRLSGRRTLLRVTTPRTRSRR